MRSDVKVKFVGTFITCKFPQPNLSTDNVEKCHSSILLQKKKKNDYKCFGCSKMILLLSLHMRKPTILVSDEV